MLDGRNPLAASFQNSNAKDAVATFGPSKEQVGRRSSHPRGSRMQHFCCDEDNMLHFLLKVPETNIAHENPHLSW